MTAVNEIIKYWECSTCNISSTDKGKQFPCSKNCDASSRGIVSTIKEPIKAPKVSVAYKC